MKERHVRVVNHMLLGKGYEMECERHPNSGVVLLGDEEMCYGCYFEYFSYCPLCGRDWEHHSDNIDCREIGEGGEMVNAADLKSANP